MTGPIIRAAAREKAARVTLLLLDVDGVLTDGRIIYDADGREIKAFHVRDGHGIKMLQRAGVEVGIITGRRSPVVEIRARELGITLVRQGASDKVAVWRDIIEEKRLAPEETAYVGDDIVDIPLLRRVGFAAAVFDAETEVVEAADYVAGRRGGRGAVREIIDFLLRARGAWESATAAYFGSGDGR
jgi:3-deoxy-D-manno-octulosonate 8-phosphate phosphatase (KDO 8-P phosphatase)